MRIGIARDRAFGFYYPDDLAAFEQAGADLIPFDTLQDKNLPPWTGFLLAAVFLSVSLSRYLPMPVCAQKSRRLLKTAAPFTPSAADSCTSADRLRGRTESFPWWG